MAAIAKHSQLHFVLSPMPLPSASPAADEKRCSEAKIEIVISSIKVISNSTRSVYSAQTASSKKVVLKCHDDENEATDEISAHYELQTLHIPHTLPLLGVLDGAFIRKPFKRVMVMADRGITLRQYVKCNHQSMKVDLVLQITKSLFETIHKLAENRMIHGDLASDNVLIDPDTKITVMDYGSLKKEVPRRMENSFTKRWYRAPEFYTWTSIYDTSADLFSLGCILYELTTGRTFLPIDFEPLTGHPNEIDFLSMHWIFARLGPPSLDYLRNTLYGTTYFTPQGVLKEPPPCPPGTYRAPVITTSWKENVCRCLQTKGATLLQADLYVKLMEKCLCYEHRISAKEALQLQILSKKADELQEASVLPIRENRASHTAPETSIETPCDACDVSLAPVKGKAAREEPHCSSSCAVQ